MTFDDLRCNAAARHWARSAPIGPSGIREPMEPVREGSIKPAPEICGKGILGRGRRHGGAGALPRSTWPAYASALARGRGHLKGASGQTGRRAPVVAALPVLVSLMALVGAAVVVPGSASATAVSGMPTLRSPIIGPGAVAVSGKIGARGGPYLYDSLGRVVFFHGVDAVYKYAPYELYPDKGKPWNLSVADASLMARMGFNVVRLGMTWSGLEPGTASANDPAICARGAPQSRPVQPGRAESLRQPPAHHHRPVSALPHLHDPRHAPGRLQRDVRGRGGARLGRLHEWRGERGPARPLVPGLRHPSGRHCLQPLLRGTTSWAICRASTTRCGAMWRRVPPGPLGARVRPVQRAVLHRRWCISTASTSTPSSSASTRGGPTWARRCTALRLHCPTNDPAQGVIPTLEASDPGALVFDEPDNFASRGYPTYLGPMDLPNLVFNVTSTAGPAARSRAIPPTCWPAPSRRCTRWSAAADRPKWRRLAAGRTALAGHRVRGHQLAGVPATITAQLDADQVGWIYWSWKYYGDPTAVRPIAGDGERASALDRRGTEPRHPQAVAGTPLRFSYSPQTDVFDMAYVPNHRIHAHRRSSSWRPGSTIGTATAPARPAPG